MKKLAIIGRGTAGSLAAAHFLRYTDWEIDWYFDSDIKPQAVGEGATLDFPNGLQNYLNFEHYNLDKIDGTFKSSIYKEGWGKGQGFHHTFPPPCLSYHFNANKLQDYILSVVKDNNRFTIKEQNITHDEIDSNFILDCSGRPQNYEEFHLSKYIPVNSVYVNQCYWDYPRFQYTLTIARPYGWVFGIPLQNRCSIGYLYNNNINTIDEVKEDIKEIFKQYNLTPSEDTNSFTFKNYYRKQNFNGRVAYNGNASYFLEPMEATSIATMIFVNKYSFDLWNNNKNNLHVNYMYITLLKEIETVIMLHYFAGSIYNTDFWYHAVNSGKKCMIVSLTQKKYKLNKSFKEMLDIDTSQNNIGFGTWPIKSFGQNILGLDIKEKLDNLVNNLQLGE
jgi:hypothetical protein